MRKLLLSIPILMFSSMASAATDQVGNVKIIKLSTFDNYAIVYFSPAYTFKDDQLCATNSTTIPGNEPQSNGPSSKMVVRFENAEKKEMYATIMAAAVTNKTVSFGAVGCDASGYPNMYRVDVLF
ncbi:MAG: hypothetical protein MJK04_13885 [Psychrosphaera sp.]|nr:hypothetical protein [Psychrosphaera sp.]